MSILGGASTARCKLAPWQECATPTDKAAIVVLDPNPSGIWVASASTIVANIDLASLVNQLPLSSALSPLGLGGLLNGIRNNIVSTLNGVTSGLLGDLTLPALPILTAGLEVEGLGSLKVDGAGCR